MTTTVTIKHEGPDVHDVKVEIYQGKLSGEAFRSKILKCGESLEECVYGTTGLYITETAVKDMDKVS